MMSEMIGYYPWQQQQWRHLQQQLIEQKLPHALLLVGIPDIGKRQFGRALAAKILCEGTAETACRECAPCHLVLAATHPDLRLVQPEESKLIRVDQIRDLLDWAAQTSQQGGARIALLFPAEQMNLQSANALLKCLEEPGSDTYFILVTDQPGKLLPTIRSRCQQVDFPRPAADDVIPWIEAQGGQISDIPFLLDLANGAPLRVAQCFDSEYLARRAAVGEELTKLLGKSTTAVSVANKIFDKERPVEVYDVLYSLFSDALKFQQTSSEKVLINKDLKIVINAICKIKDSAGILAAIDLINKNRIAVTSSSNLNPQLLLESLFIKTFSPEIST